jgi:iron complex outermembrane receptor protein
VIGTPPLSTSVIANAAKMRTRGFEAEVTAVPVDGLTLSGTFGYLDSEYLTYTSQQLVNGQIITLDLSSEPVEVPKYTYSLTAAYEVPLGADNLKFVAILAGQSTRPFGAQALLRDTVEEGPYALVNGRISYNSTALDAEFALWAENLFAKKYYAGGGTGESFGFNVRYPGMPRTFGIEVIKRF